MSSPKGFFVTKEHTKTDSICDYCAVYALCMDNWGKLVSEEIGLNCKEGLPILYLPLEKLKAGRF